MTLVIRATSATIIPKYFWKYIYEHPVVYDMIVNGTSGVRPKCNEGRPKRVTEWRSVSRKWIIR